MSKNLSQLISQHEGKEIEPEFPFEIDEKDRLSHKIISFSFKYILLNSHEYSFRKKLFKNDSIKLLEKLKYYSEIKYSEAVNSNWRNHFKINDPPGRKHKQLINNALKDEKDFGNEVPALGHFALYTETNANNKPARIYFLVGRDAKLFLLFYDRDHKIDIVNY